VDRGSVRQNIAPAAPAADHSAGGKNAHIKRQQQKTSAACFPMAVLFN